MEEEKGTTNLGFPGKWLLKTKVVVWKLVFTGTRACGRV